MVKTHYTVINKSASVIFGLVKHIILSYIAIAYQEVQDYSHPHIQFIAMLTRYSIVQKAIDN